MPEIHPISPKGNQLVYSSGLENESIWGVDLIADTSRSGPPGLVISEKGTLRGHNFSPRREEDCVRIRRSGYSEIWACDSDGSNCGQVTSLHGTAGAARWSPDGHYIAFEFHPQEHSEVYVVEVAGGLPRLMATFPGADNGGPSWSRDGQWIYFYSDRGGGPLSVMEGTGSTVDLLSR